MVSTTASWPVYKATTTVKRTSLLSQVSGSETRQDKRLNISIRTFLKWNFNYLFQTRISSTWRRFEDTRQLRFCGSLPSSSSVLWWCSAFSESMAVLTPPATNSARKGLFRATRRALRRPPSCRKDLQKRCPPIAPTIHDWRRSLPSFLMEAVHWPRHKSHPASSTKIAPHPAAPTTATIQSSRSPAVLIVSWWRIWKWHGAWDPVIQSSARSILTTLVRERRRPITTPEMKS